MPTIAYRIIDERPRPGGPGTLYLVVITTTTPTSYGYDVTSQSAWLTEDELWAL